MLVPESVLAALIAGTATLSASFLQLRSALLREGIRGPSAAARRKNRLQLIIFFVIIGGAAAAGFALSQWLTAGERAAQSTLQHELQERVAEITRTTSQLELTRGSERAEIESGALRRIGADGVVVAATVAACHPALVVSPPPGATSPPGAASESPAPAPRTCTEAEASPVTLCATLPGDASITEVALFSRAADSDTPWSSSRYLPGQEAGQARFAEKYSEGTPEAGVRQVCQEFAHWSAEHARAVRVVVHYSLPALTAHN
jgi:hypothetical protein